MFSLPANVDGVRCVMEQQGVKAAKGQAERTAWRNVRDWIMAQMAIIEAGMVQMEEVFLPYMTDGKGRTVYQLYQRGTLALEGGTEQRTQCFFIRGQAAVYGRGREYIRESAFPVYGGDLQRKER